MTYRELKEKLDALNELQLDDTVTIYDFSRDKYYGIYETTLDIANKLYLTLRIFAGAK